MSCHSLSSSSEESPGCPPDRSLQRTFGPGGCRDFELDDMGPIFQRVEARSPSGHRLRIGPRMREPADELVGLGVARRAAAKLDAKGLEAHELVPPGVSRSRSRWDVHGTSGN